MEPAFSFAHLSDPHLPPPDAPGWRALSAKRFLALLSWRRKKGRTLRPAVLDALLADVAAAHPDHVAVTGDLVNLALPAEFAAARRWLRGLGDPAAVSVVPGNHEALVAPPAGLAPEEGLESWAPWLRGDDGEGFPTVRRRGPVAFLGLSSAVPTPPLLASGRLGPAQLRAAEEALLRLGGEGLFRVVLIHHPPAETGGWRVALRDAAALREVLARAGAELVLHGHLHRSRLLLLRGPGGAPIPVSGVPAAAHDGVGVRASRWNRHAVRRCDEGGWWLETRARGWDPATGGFGDLGQWRMRVEPAR